MSKSVTVSKLESLLARIRGRAAEPRPAAASPASKTSQAPGVARAVAPAPAPSPAAPPPPAPAPPVAAASPAAPPAPPPLAPAVVAPPPPVARSVQRVDASPSVIIEGVDQATLPPPAMANDDFAVDIDMSPITPPPPPMEEEPAPSAREPSLSQERLSAAPSPSTDPPEALADADDVGPTIEQGEALADEVDEASLAGEEGQDEPPISSRRPVAPPPEERLAELAFGAGEPQPPRHTPPPKSGRLPAPPSVDFDGDVTRVRDAVALAAEDDAAQPPSHVSRAAVLTARPARPNLGSSPRVADIVGQAQAFAPATFLELLDASLSLG